MKKMQWQGLLSAMLLLMSILSGCSSGGGSPSPASTISSTGTAILLDAPVSGITFSDGYANAITGQDGSFNFTVGKAVTFSLGDIILGSYTPASANVSVVSLVDLIPGSAGTSDPYVQQISVLLMTLDGDNNPANGIQINAATAQAMLGQTVDFTNPASVIALLGAVAPGVTPVTGAQATAHMNAARWATMGGAYKGTFSGTCTLGPSSGNWSVALDTNGNVTGTALETSTATTYTYGVTGSITPMGSLTASAAGQAGTSQWNGSLSLHGVFNGTWIDQAAGCSGTFHGSKASNNLANFTGIYQGIFSGTDAGTWSVNVDAAGNISGSGISQSIGAFTLSGNTNGSGTTSMTQAVGGVSTGASFSGVFNPFGGVLGVWNDANTTASGTFTGFRN